MLKPPKSGEAREWSRRLRESLEVISYKYLLKAGGLSFFPETALFFLTSAMHHPKTLIGQELLHQTIVNYKKFFSNKNYQSITFWHNNLNFNGLCTVILCFKLTLSITILKITNICRWNRYHFLRFTDIGSAIKDAGFGINRYLLKK